MRRPVHIFVDFSGLSTCHILLHAAAVAAAAAQCLCAVRERSVTARTRSPDTADRRMTECPVGADQL